MEKIDRTVAKRKFTRILNSIKSRIDDQSDVSIVQEYFQELKQQWSVVQDKHDHYVTSLFADDPTKMEEEDAWIVDVDCAFSKIESEVCSYIKGCDNVKKSELQHGARIQRQMEEIALKATMQEATSLIVNDNGTVLAGDVKENLKLQFEKCRDANKIVLSGLKEDEEVKQEMAWLTQLQSIYSKIQSDISKYIDTKTSEAAVSDVTHAVKSIKLERMQLPRFSGNIRDYPRFKSDFKRHVMPEVKDDDSAAYALKSCLDRSVADVVRNVDSDLNEMWTRLDDKFGRASKLVDVVINDIKKVRSVEDGDSKRFIELVDIVETGFCDLRRVKFEKEISNSAVVSIIEGKLPLSIQLKWAEMVNCSDSEVEELDKFPHLLQFLLGQKRAMEYVASDLRRVPHVRGFSNHVDSSREDQGDGSQHRMSNNYRCLVHKNNIHATEDCSEYLGKDPVTRVKIVGEAKACWSCLKLYHRSADCRSRRQCGKDGCTKFHHETLHEAHVNGVDFNSFRNIVMMASKGASEGNKNSVCLLQLMSIPVSESQSVNVLWDGGATVSLITFKKAETIGLYGKPIKITVIMVGGKEKRINSFEYNLSLIDKSDKEVVLRVYGIEQISTAVEKIKIDEVVKLFPNLQAKDIERPEGEIDVLIGLEYAGFHPVRTNSNGHLLLLSNQFGKCIGGSYPLLVEGTRKVIQHVTIHHVKGVDIKEFYDIESLGISCSPKCGNCKCGHCPVGSKPYSIREERELNLIEKGLELKDKTWYANYPWIRDPNDLPDNYATAYAMLRSTERRLAKYSEHADLYEKYIDEMIQRGVARKLTLNEVQKYNVPVDYLSHHEVLKLESESTPCRIVFNASANFSGHILNEYWAKGPDLLNNLVGILMRFRENYIAISGDISKMYHAVKIGTLDQNTHRFLWRNMDITKEPDIYVITSVSFGDRPAGNIATVALRKTAQKFSMTYPRAVKTITENTYVDDMIDSVDTDEEAQSLSDNIDEILHSGGFKVKKWAVSRSLSTSNMIMNCFPGLNDDGQKVLGMYWKLNSDSFKFKVRLNFSPKVRKRQTGRNLSRQEVPELIPKELTKRMILSQVNGIYDPLGLASPVIMKAKILMRKFHIEGLKHLDWDDVIPAQFRDEWIDYFTELFQMEDISFVRCIKSTNSVGDPILILFSDASGDAYVVCAYLRYEQNDGSFQSRLIMSKSRLSPLRIISIVRLELCGAVLSARLKKYLQMEMRVRISKIYHLVDSNIVRAMVQKESYGFNTFAAIRVGEIQEYTSISQWYWVSGDLNIADLITRGADPKSLGEESIWQNGPEFLKLPESEWPISDDVSDVEVPELLKAVLKIRVTNPFTISQVIDIMRYSSYIKLMRVTARILVLCKQKRKSFSCIGKNICSEMLQAARNAWIFDAQNELKEQFERNKFSRLGAYCRNDGIIVVGSRLSRNNIMSYDNEELVLLPYGHKMSRLFVEFIHGLSHVGVSATVAKSRLHFWIIGVRRMVRAVVHKCVICKRNQGITESQQMGLLPECRLKPAPAWYTTYLDFFGPFITRGETNKRTRGKAYGLIFSCSVSRAVYLDIASDYSMPAFLMVLRRFVSLRGYPSKIISDPGSQLVAASKELHQVVDQFDTETLQNFGTEYGLEWEFTSANAPWQNGCSEGLIRTVKKLLKNIINDQALMFSELQTVMFEVANLINERPTGIHPTKPD